MEWLCVCALTWVSVHHSGCVKVRLAAGVFVNRAANIKPTEPCLMLTRREHGAILGIDTIAWHRE